MRKVLIGGAWVYANGPLHIGHIAGLLPADVIARYYRLRGYEVSYVSGSDCHGTPITIRAAKENKSPQEISEYYHQEFIKGFDYLGFSYDYYSKTTDPQHIKFCTEFHKKLYESPLITEKEEPQAYCEVCQKFLPDRLVSGTCPFCGGIAKGDQCDHCGAILSAIELLDAQCHDCHEQPIFKKEKHLYLGISQLESELQSLVDQGKFWKPNAVDFTNRYIKEGLRNRAITRTLDWGIRVPREGYEGKCIYIWAENVLGYISANQADCQVNGKDFEGFWKEDTLQYYVHGKDNIPFHTIILPSLQLAHGGFKKLPDHIVSSEYLTLEGRKISTSEDWAIWINDLIDVLNPDALRYYLLANNPEKRDGDFSTQEFLHANNSELLGGYGNFINRTLTFLKKSFDNQVPAGGVEPNILKEVSKAYVEVGLHIEKGEIKKGIRRIFELVRFSNKYFDEEKPWISVKEDREKANQTIYNCIYLIINLAQLLEPYLPFSSEKVLSWFSLGKSWEIVDPVVGQTIGEIEILFDRLQDLELI